MDGCFRDKMSSHPITVFNDYIVCDLFGLSSAVRKLSDFDLPLANIHFIKS